MKKVLKYRYKKLYLKILNFEGYDCGHTMMCTLSSEYYNLSVSFNRVADKLSKIDKNCPSFRYEV
jgi:hypothetical protein